MRYFFLFFFFTSLHANWSTLTETEPSTLIEGIASVITGHVYFPEEDIIIEGAEPLKLKRNYVGVGQQHQLFPHLFAEFLIAGRIVNIVESNGTTLSFVHHPLTKKQKKKKKRKNENKENNHNYIFDPIDLSHLPGATNTSRGILSARTNIKNMGIELYDDWKYLIVHCADGTQRRYIPIPDQKRVKIDQEKPYHQYSFYLKSEELPNGNKIIYEWDGTNLKSVRTTNPAENTIYAQVHFHYPHPNQIDATTSDGRRLEYRCIGWGGKNEFILASINSPQFPEETLHYEERMGHPFLKEVHLPEGRRFSIIRDEAHRVKEIKAPVGSNNALVATHTFTYFPDQRRTDVANSQGAITRYFWSGETRLICIEHYAKNGKLYNRERIGWGKNGTRDAGNLLFRTLFDQDNKPISSRSYRYDEKGNVEEEIFWGNLSGASLLTTEQDGNPIRGETYKKRFQYNELNLKVREEEDKGKVTTYEYLPDTNLCTAVFIYDGPMLKRRHFTVYDDLVPVREIDDDGSTTGINDLTSVTYRRIKEITPIDSGPYTNLPQCIDEKYLDAGRETLLKRTVLEYTTGARVCSQEIYDAIGNFCYTLYTEYDHKGRPIVESNALGQVAKSRYDEVGNRIFFSDFSGKTQLHTSYDHANRLNRVEERTQTAVRVTEHAYDTESNRIATTDFRNNTVCYIYDGFNHVLETHTSLVQDTEGQVMHPILCVEYNGAGQEKVRIDAKGNATRIHYNAYGKPIEIEHPDKTKEYFSYYLNGNLKTHIDPIGTQTTYTYDVFDRKTAKVISFKDEILAQEFFTYDSFQLTKKTDADGHTTYYTYDGAGRKIAEELDGRRTTYSYDALGRLHIAEQGGLFLVKEYDLLNRVLSEKKQDAKGTILFKEEYQYDAAGNKTVHITYPNNTRAEETYCYDAFNRLIEKRDPLGFVTTTAYLDQYENNLGQHVLQKIVTDALHNHTIETYDAKERLICLQKTNAEDKLLFQEDYFYDANDNISRQKSNVISKESSPRILTTRWSYDVRNRISCMQEACDEPEERSTHYTYTRNGQLEQKKKPDGILLRYVYDRLGRCTEMLSSDNTVHYTFDYNRKGQLIRSTDMLRKISNEKEWNVHGQLHTERLSNGYRLSCEYDEQGRRTVLHLPDGTHIDYTYDPLFMRSVQRVRGASSYAHFFISYDLAGNLLEEKHIDHMQSQYGIDLLGRRYAISYPRYAQQVLSYDPVGNILSMQFPEEQVQYRYDDLNQLEQETGFFAHESTCKSNILNQIPQFTYDANGNPVSVGNRHFSYDALDRLISIEENGDRYLFIYDAEHRRITKQVFTLDCVRETVHYLYEGQNEIGSIGQDGQWRDLRILGPTPNAEIGAAVAIELQGQPCVPIHDLQGNVCMVIPHGSMPERYRYSAFGKEYAPRARCAWRFSSKRTDETQLVYYGRRYYSPQHERWLTPDPQEAGMNSYAFKSNDPLNRKDLFVKVSRENAEKSIIDYESNRWLRKMLPASRL